MSCLGCVKPTSAPQKKPVSKPKEAALKEAEGRQSCFSKMAASIGCNFYAKLKASAIDDSGSMIRIKAMISERELAHAFKFSRNTLAQTHFVFIIDVADWGDLEAAKMSEALLGALSFQIEQEMKLNMAEPQWKAAFLLIDTHCHHCRRVVRQSQIIKMAEATDHDLCIKCGKLPKQTFVIETSNEEMPPEKVAKQSSKSSKENPLKKLGKDQRPSQLAAILQQLERKMKQVFDLEEEDEKFEHFDDFRAPGNLQMRTFALQKWSTILTENILTSEEEHVSFVLGLNPFEAGLQDQICQLKAWIKDRQVLSSAMLIFKHEERGRSHLLLQDNVKSMAALQNTISSFLPEELPGMSNRHQSQKDLLLENSPKACVLISKVEGQLQYSFDDLRTALIVQIEALKSPIRLPIRVDDSYIILKMQMLKQGKKERKAVFKTDVVVPKDQNLEDTFLKLKAAIQTQFSLAREKAGLQSKVPVQIELPQKEQNMSDSFESGSKGIVENKIASTTLKIQEICQVLGGVDQELPNKAQLRREVKRTALAIDVLISIITRVLGGEPGEEGVVTQWTERVLNQLLVLSEQCGVLERMIFILNRGSSLTEGCRLQIEEIRFNTGRPGWNDLGLCCLSQDKAIIPEVSPEEEEQAVEDSFHHHRVMSEIMSITEQSEVPEDEPVIGEEGGTPLENLSPDVSFLKKVALSSEKCLIEKRKKNISMVDPPIQLMSAVAFSADKTARRALDEEDDVYEDADMKFLMWQSPGKSGKAMSKFGTINSETVNSEFNTNIKQSRLARIPEERNEGRLGGGWNSPLDDSSIGENLGEDVVQPHRVSEGLNTLRNQGVLGRFDSPDEAESQNPMGVEDARNFEEVINRHEHSMSEHSSDPSYIISCVETQEIENETGQQESKIPRSERKAQAPKTNAFFHQDLNLLNKMTLTMNELTSKPYPIRTSNLLNRLAQENAHIEEVNSCIRSKIGLEVNLLPSERATFYKTKGLMVSVKHKQRAFKKNVDYFQRLYALLNDSRVFRILNNPEMEISEVQTPRSALDFLTPRSNKMLPFTQRNLEVYKRAMEAHQSRRNYEITEMEEHSDPMTPAKNKVLISVTSQTKYDPTAETPRIATLPKFEHQQETLGRGASRGIANIGFGSRRWNEQESDTTPRRLEFLRETEECNYESDEDLEETLINSFAPTPVKVTW